MEYLEYGTRIIKEIFECVSGINEESIQALVSEIMKADKIFCDGKGRSGLQSKAFAMRLAQMGLAAYDSQGVTTPPIQKGHLLIIASGSGKTENLVEHAKKAKEVGARIALITTNPDSVIGKMSDLTVVINAESKSQQEKKSIQPMGTLFEQSLEICMDICVMMLMKEIPVTNDQMYALHNNLE